MASTVEHTTGDSQGKEANSVQFLFGGVNPVEEPFIVKLCWFNPVGLQDLLGGIHTNTSLQCSK